MIVKRKSWCSLKTLGSVGDYFSNFGGIDVFFCAIVNSVNQSKLSVWVEVQSKLYEFWQICVYELLDSTACYTCQYLISAAEQMNLQSLLFVPFVPYASIR